jgi:hypothetical protein
MKDPNPGMQRERVLALYPYPNQRRAAYLVAMQRKCICPHNKGESYNGGRHVGRGSSHDPQVQIDRANIRNMATKVVLPFGQIHRKDL